MGRVLLAWAVAIVVALPSAAAEPRDPLVRARLLYNQRQFAEAIAAADEVRRDPVHADSADLVAARAYLERYRESAADEDLVSARDRLRRINPEKFVEREQVEFIVGLGETLYLDQATGAAAAVFESVLAHQEMSPGARDRVIDWWASAVDADARPRPEIERQGLYQKIRDRMQQELSNNPTSTAAAYWCAAAARGQGDLQAAWDAAQAGWVRAPLNPDRGAALRGDLDRLVEQALIPERSRMLGQPQETLRMEWESFKQRWNK
jgi:hypothetical protein